MKKPFLLTWMIAFFALQVLVAVTLIGVNAWRKANDLPPLYDYPGGCGECSPDQ